MVTIFSLHAILHNCIISNGLTLRLLQLILPLLQKEVDELLAMDTIDPCTGGAGFYSNVSGS